MIIRCIKEEDFKKLKNSEFTDAKVRVYYGFDNYRNDVAFVNAIVGIIKMDHPEIPFEDMLVHYVDMCESIRHSDYTTIQVLVNTNYVKNNINEYTIL